MSRYYIPTDKTVRGNFLDDLQADKEAIAAGFESVQNEEKMMDAGGAGVDYIHFLTQPNAEDAFMVDGQIYRFFTGSPPRPPRPPWRPPWRPPIRPIPPWEPLPRDIVPREIPPDEFDVGILIGGTIEETIDHAAAAIEGNIYTGVRGIRAVNGAGPVLLLAARWAGSDSNFPVEESTGGVRMVVGEGEARSAAEPRQRKVITCNYSMNDRDITALAAPCEIPLMCCIASTAPQFGGAIILRGMGLQVVPFTADIGFGVRQIGDELWIITVHDLGGIIQSGDSLLVTAWT